MRPSDDTASARTWAGRWTSRASAHSASCDAGVPDGGERVDDHLGRLLAANEREHRADRVVVAAKQRLDPRGKAVSFVAGGDGRQEVVDPLLVRGRTGGDRRHAARPSCRAAARTLACRSDGRAPHETVASAADAASDHKARRDRDGASHPHMQPHAPRARGPESCARDRQETAGCVRP